MPLEVADVGAVNENVLAGSSSCLVLLDLDLYDFTRVLNDLANESAVAAADFTEDTFVEEDDTTDEPVAPEDTDLEPGAVRRTVGLDHAPHAVELPADEEGDEEVVRVPEPLEVGPPPFLDGEVDHREETRVHDPPSRAGSGGEVCSEEGEDLWAHTDRGCVCEREADEVDHVGGGVDDGEREDRPCYRFMEGNVLVEWNE